MLALIKGDSFHGFIGTETSVEVNGEKVCIGDLVKVAESVHNVQCVGLVAIFRNKISVMGVAGTPLSKLELLEIVKSHKELTTDSNLDDGYFNVVNFIE